MRPISVLQEFGKISAKLLSNRLGKILLQQPNLLNSAQRAFLKDGCTAQCLSTFLNVIEDFQARRRTDKTASLFLLAYDQVKAYDSVQSYTIKASLERFNCHQSLSAMSCQTSRKQPVVSRLSTVPQMTLQWKHLSDKATLSLP
jgi:hypothetical protein